MTAWTSEDRAWPNHLDLEKEIALPSNWRAIAGEYRPERIKVPVDMSEYKWESNRKFLAIGAHSSQKGSGCSMLLRFMHRDELFWTPKRFPVVHVVGDGDESDEEEGGGGGGRDKHVCPQELVRLNAKIEGGEGKEEEFEYEWKRSYGPATSGLIQTNKKQLTFRAPWNKGTRDIKMEFEVRVRSKTTKYVSFPTAVGVIVHGWDSRGFGVNVARKAKVKASSQREHSGQGATSAIDGVVDGLLRKIPTVIGDQTKEWRSKEKAGAWIFLSWLVPVNVGKVELFDCVSCESHILSGQLVFSDGTVIDVGELDSVAAPTTIEFPTKSISSLNFSVTKVSNETIDVGLAEIMVFEALTTKLCPHPDQQMPSKVTVQPTTGSTMPKSESTIQSSTSLSFVVLIYFGGSISILIFFLVAFHSKQTKEKQDHSV